MRCGAALPRAETRGCTLKRAPHAALILIAAVLFGQRQAGELRLQIVDAAGALLPATVEITGQATQVRHRIEAKDGTAIVPVLPFGVYRVSVQHPSFTGATLLVEIKSAVPEVRRVTLGLATIET